MGKYDKPFKVSGSPAMQETEEKLDKALAQEPNDLTQPVTHSTELVQTVEVPAQQEATETPDTESNIATIRKRFNKRYNVDVGADQNRVTTTIEHEDYDALVVYKKNFKGDKKQRKPTIGDLISQAVHEYVDKLLESGELK